MVHKVQDNVIILKSQDYSESDLIINALSQSNGKIGLIARGIKKKNYLPEVLDIYSIEFKPKISIDRLVSFSNARPQRSFATIRSNLAAFICACHWVEVLDLLTLEQQADASEFYPLCIENLEKLNSSKDPRELLKILYIAIQDALILSGYWNSRPAPPSFNRLSAMSNKIQELANRELKSFRSVKDLAQSLKQPQLQP